jgi:hypothetical protein
MLSSHVLTKPSGYYKGVRFMARVFGFHCTILLKTNSCCVQWKLSFVCISLTWPLMRSTYQQRCWSVSLLTCRSRIFFFGYVKLTDYFYLWFLVQVRLCYWLLVYSILPPIFMLLWTATNKGLPGQSTEPIHVLPVSSCKVLWFLFPLVT